MSGIRFDQVVKQYPNGVRALDGVSLDIADGEFVVLVGPSGCGKSTLLRSVAGLERLTDGAIYIGDRNVTNLQPKDRDIAMVFQSYALYPHLTVRENIGFGLKLRGAPRAVVHERATAVGATLGLDELLDRRPAQLSGGQRQRVAMGRAIAREPAAYLMDEPLSNLDAKLRVAMRAELVELHQRLGVTTVFVTHDQVEAMTLGERVAVLNDGKLLQIDTPREVFARPADLFVASFIGSPAMNFLEVGVGDGALSFGDQSIEIPDASLPAGRGDRYILGVRPQGFERASGGASIRVEATVVEDLGTESFVHFDLDVPSVAHTLRLEDGAEPLPQSRTRFVARLDSKHAVRNGERLDLSLDPDALYYFDPDTHRRVPRRAEVERGEMASNV